MLFGVSRKEHRQLELILDIRSASVGASIVSFGEDIPSVLYSIRVPITSAATSSETLVPAMLTTLQQVLERLVGEGVPVAGDPIKHTTVTFGAPWYAAKVRDLVLKKETPFSLTRKKFDVLLAKQVELEKERSSGHTMIEHDVTHVVINGYELQDPFDKKTKELLVAFYASFIDTDILKKVEDTIDTHFHKVAVTYRTFPMVLFTTLRDMFWNVERFTFFDVGGSVTDIGIVDKGAITNIASIPYGKNQLLKDVQAACTMDEATVASTIAMLARGEMHPSCNQNVLEALAAAEKTWVEHIQKLIDTEGLSLPQRVFITADNAIAPIFKEVFGAIETRKNIFGTDQELQLAILSAEHFRKHISFSAEKPIDTFTILTAVFLQATK